MAEFEDWEVHMLAEHIVVQGGDEMSGTSVRDKGLCRLLAAMQLQCRGEEVCGNCRLGGLGICIFEHAENEPPPEPCMATTAV